MTWYFQWCDILPRKRKISCKRPGDPKLTCWGTVERPLRDFPFIKEECNFERCALIKIWLIWTPNPCSLVSEWQRYIILHDKMMLMVESILPCLNLYMHTSPPFWTTKYLWVYLVKKTITFGRHIIYVFKF